MFILFPLALTLSAQSAEVSGALQRATTRADVALCTPAGGPKRAPPLWLAAQIGSVSSAQTSVAAQERTPLELWRAADGLFYVDGDINGHRVRFVVDTGASMVILTANDARRAGVLADRNARPLETQTATGKSAMTPVTLASMQVGSTGVAAAPAAIAPEGLSVSLLGQSWLSHLASVTIEGNRMTLR